ncbi:hypothetical protein EV426DRAFT_699786 [Tirmania nivea]|nr:hypothetical protein EV426DRAFT_699786 [Tirmania nivea]
MAPSPETKWKGHLSQSPEASEAYEMKMFASQTLHNPLGKERLHRHRSSPTGLIHPNPATPSPPVASTRNAQSGQGGGCFIDGEFVPCPKGDASPSLVMAPILINFVGKAKRSPQSAPNMADGFHITSGCSQYNINGKEKGDEEAWDAVEAFFTYLYRSIVGR